MIGIKLLESVITEQSGRYGEKLRAITPSIHMMLDKAKLKLQESLQKIVNTGNVGFIAIILCK